MLETIREFAAERLEPDRCDDLLRRLLETLTAMFENDKHAPESPGPPAMELAQEERPNIDVALQWATDAGEAESGLRLLWMLEMYWATNDPRRADANESSALLAAGGEHLDPASYARALRFRGATYDLMGETALSEPEYERAIEDVPVGWRRRPGRAPQSSHRERSSKPGRPRPGRPHCR